MKNLLLYVLLSTSLTLQAQITLTTADFANPGDTVRMSRTSTTTTDYASTGANYFWDFSDLVAESQKLVPFTDMSNVSGFVSFVFGAFAPSEYEASYYLPSQDIPIDQLGDFLPIPLEDVYQFTKKDSDSITSIGFALKVDGNEVPVKSDTIETRYKFPINYGDAYTSRGYTNLDMNPFYDAVWIQHRERNSEVDGWGNVVTPFGAFSALRIKHTINESDSLRIVVFGNQVWLPIPLPTSVIYEWWAAGQKEPVMRVTTNDVLGNETVTGIEYRDNYLGLDAGIAENTKGVQVFPNPVNDVLTLHGLEGTYSFEIFTVTGEKVLTEANVKQINVEHLPSGAYLLLVKTTAGTSICPFVKQ